jgi:hypothetical protein
MTKSNLAFIFGMNLIRSDSPSMQFGEVSKVSNAFRVCLDIYTDIVDAVM